MARQTLTFDPVIAGASTPTMSIDDTETFKTPDGPKLGSDLEVGDHVGFGSSPSWLAIATITPEE